MVLPEGAIALPLVLAPFTAFCVMIGLHWSIKSKGTIGSVVGAVLIAGLFAGFLGLCGIPAGKNLPYIGALITAANPVNLLWAVIYPASTIERSLTTSVVAGRTWMVMGSALAAVVYGAVVYGMHTNMKRSFMMTVRKLAGTN
jgi:hypothetical protein